MPAVLGLPLGIAAVIFSALLFTNALEWLGHRLRLGQAALGSVFAAMGTALPEASIALLAALVPGNGGGGDSVSVGAVLGAPMLLATVGFAVLGLGALRARRGALVLSRRATVRDLVIYVVAFGSAAAVGVAGLGVAFRAVLAAALVIGYGVYVAATVGGASAVSEGAPRPSGLWLARGSTQPPWWVILGQLALAVGLMLAGAELFVRFLTGLAAEFALSGFVLAVVLAPLATELPETLNSVLWIGQEKDQLAVGNITGAMVLQGAVVPAVGLAFTPWHFDTVETVAAAVALAGALMPLGALTLARRLPPWYLLCPAALYVAFIVWVL